VIEVTESFHFSQSLKTDRRNHIFRQQGSPHFVNCVTRWTKEALSGFWIN